MNYTIIGAGSLGLAYGGLLAEAGEHVCFLTRRAEQANILQSQGLTIIGPSKTRTLKVSATVSINEVQEPDVILILVKSYDTSSAAMCAKHIMGPQSHILTLQSGLGNIEAIEEQVKNAHVIAGVSFLGAKRIDDNHVSLGANMKTTIGNLDGSYDNTLDNVAKSLSSTGIDLTISTKVKNAIWDKMVVICGQNALGAITGFTFGQMLECPTTHEITKRVLSEVVAIGKKDGVIFEFSDPVERLKVNWRTLINHKVSMRQDLEAKKRTEIDAINGAIVRLGEKYGIRTPYNELIMFFIKMIEESWSLN